MGVVGSFQWRFWLSHSLVIKGEVFDEGNTTMPVRFDRIDVPKCDVIDGDDQ
jgi:hypothetical protein